MTAPRFFVYLGFAMSTADKNSTAPASSSPESPRAATPAKTPVQTLQEKEAEALLGENIDDAVELFVDEDLLGHLNRAADSPASRAFQRQLFVDAMAAVARALPRVPGLSSLELADIDGTVLGRIVDAIAPQPGDNIVEIGPGLAALVVGMLTPWSNELFIKLAKNCFNYELQGKYASAD